MTVKNPRTATPKSSRLGLHSVCHIWSTLFLVVNGVLELNCVMLLGARNHINVHINVSVLDI